MSEVYAFVRLECVVKETALSTSMNQGTFLFFMTIESSRNVLSML